MMPTGNPVQFDAVGKALNRMLAAWKQKNGDVDPDLTRHGNNFDLTSKASLLKSVARGVPLIQPDLVQSKGPGDQANIVKILRGPLPNPVPAKAAFPQMPDGGPIADPADVQIIVDWINGGCLD